MDCDERSALFKLGLEPGEEHTVFSVSRGRTLTPEANEPKYTIAVCKGSALIEETKLLLRAWKPTESLNDFQNRVLREDLLGRATAYRVKDIVRRVFARRLMQPTSAPAARLKVLLERSYTRVVTDLLLLYAARHDDALRDTIVQVYWVAVREGQLQIMPAHLLKFLREAELEGRMAEPWSEQVRIKVARGLLGAIAGFGLMREIGRGRREVVAYQPSDEAVIYTAYDLHFEGLTDSAVVAHEDWQVFGLSEAEVRSSLDRLTYRRWGVIQAAGSVVRISWNFTDMEAVIDALTR